MAPETTIINRRPRYLEPLPQQKIKLPAPPVVNPPVKSNWIVVLLPLAGVFIMVAFYGGMNGNYLLAIPMGVMSLISVITSIITRASQNKAYKKQVEEKEAAYSKTLQARRNELEMLRREQQRILINKDPDPQVLLFLAQQRDPRLWERTAYDDDFLYLRVGTGALSSTVIVETPNSDFIDSRLNEIYELQQEYSRVPQVPILVDLQAGPLGIVGSLAARNAIARSLICSLAVHHSPDEVYLMAVYSPSQFQDWKWLMWLPHTHVLDRADYRPYLANDSLTAQALFRELLEELHRRQNQWDAACQDGATPNWPWLVLLMADENVMRHDPALDLMLSREGRNLHVTGLFLVENVAHVPSGCASYIECLPQQVVRYIRAGYGTEGAPLECAGISAGISHCEQLARALAPLQAYSMRSESPLPTHVRLFNLLHIRDIDKEDVCARWQVRDPESYLKVIIGERRGNQPLVLDLNHTGHGPHGLVAGTTGSGKSELLQTLVLGLAFTHHPYDVGFVLVDFKGGGTFSELAKLPHTLGMVTDLSGSLTSRALVALQAEVDKRKRLLNDANVNDIGPYQERFWRGMVKEPLPRLIVIIDEFAELVRDYPDFMDGLIAIARVGRSLGIHLILATQSPAGVVSQQIWANAKFRICLRVESRQESMEMLHRPEAANLPRIPGRGYLQVGNNDVFEIFQVARVAGAYSGGEHTETLLPQQMERIIINEVTPLGTRKELFDSRKIAGTQVAKHTITDLDVAVKHLINEGQRLGIARLPSPWPDPLPERLVLSDLLKELGFGGWNGEIWDFSTNNVDDVQYKLCPRCGQPLRSNARFCRRCGHAVSFAAESTLNSLLSPRSPNLPNRPWLTATLGLLDDPAKQRQLPFHLNLPEQDGHFILVGAPGSGKELWLRTLVMSLVYAHAPDELHLCLIEFGGQALQVFKDLPHTIGYFTAMDEERIQRMLLILGDALTGRKDKCSSMGVDSLVKLRELSPSAAFPAIVVIVTGFSEFRSSFQEEQLQFTRLIREGGPYGIHVVITGDRAGDFPSAINSVVARKATLRLADSTEYAMVLGIAPKISREQQMPVGRGWYGRPPLEFQTAEPARADDERLLIAELQREVRAMQEAVERVKIIQPTWCSLLPEPVENLPAVLLWNDLLKRIHNMEVESPFLGVPLGIDTVRMGPVWINLIADGPDFIVAGSSQSGKTNLLWTWTLALATAYSPQQLQFVLLSGRHDSLWPLKPLQHVIEYCRAPDEFLRNRVINKIMDEIQYRENEIPSVGDGTLPFAHWVIVCDDYDEFNNFVSNDREIVAGLERLAKRGRDVNMHTIISGPLPAMGVSFGDPVMRQLKLGRSGILLRLLDAGDQNPLGVRIRATDIRNMSAGRGFFVHNGVEQAVHFATAGDQSAVSDQVAQVNTYWKDQKAIT